MAKTIFGIKKPKQVAAPIMPMPDDEAIKAAKKRSILASLGRGGRTSTILTGASDSKLGG